METYTITKAMISSAVARGIREMEEDPHRSVRRLADLGKQFSSSRFHRYVFSVMQELLSNENSAYYTMMDNLIKYSDHEAMKIFGVNIGYMSWTYGARKIRESERKDGIAIPWTILLRYSPLPDSGMSVRDIAKLVEQGKKLGIYSYIIRQECVPYENYDILDLFEKNKECGFLWLRSNGRLSAAQVEFLKNCKNTAVVLPVDDSESFLTSSLLKDQKVLQAMYTTYTEDDVRNERLAEKLRQMLTSETALFLYLPEEGYSTSAYDWSISMRLKQQYPVLTADYYGDALNIGRMTVGHSRIVEIGSDGRILHPADKAGMPFPFDADLKETFKELLSGTEFTNLED